MSEPVTDLDLNANELNIRARNEWKGEALEAFACANCGAIYIGVPDRHLFLTNPYNPVEASPYNLPHKTHCPKCKAVIHNPKVKDDSGTRCVTRKELAGSEWHWMLIKK